MTSEKHNGPVSAVGASPYAARPDMPRDQNLLKIGELARRAGVNRGTIQFYLREGLLPRPVKTHRNMAYYDESCVDRIRAIKELQTKRHLPLAAIRELLDSSRTGSDTARALLEAQRVALENLSPPTPPGPLTLAAAARAFSLQLSLVEELEHLGLVTARLEGGKRLLSGADLEVLAAVANLSRLGFEEQLGFRPQDLVIYSRAMEQLLQDEVRTFLRVARRADVAERVPGLARSAVDAATMLLVAVRRKLVTDLVSSPDGQLLEALRDSPPAGAERAGGRRRRAARGK